MLRERLASRPRDELLSIAERRAAIDAFAAQHALAITVTRSIIGGVSVERHDVGDPQPQAILVYAHGGAFVIGSAATHRSFAASIGRSAAMPLVAVDYRLAPEHGFPAARDDLVAVYAELARGGADIALVGDSAGGGLVLQAALSIRDRGLPPPVAIAVTSPWVDLSCSNLSYERLQAEETMLSAAGLKLDAARYLDGRDPRDPSVSPVHARLDDLPPVLIQVGEHEILFDDAVQLADALARDGVAVELELWEGMTHAWHVFRDLLPEASAATTRIGMFLAAAAAPDRTFVSEPGRGSMSPP